MFLSILMAVVGCAASNPSPKHRVVFDKHVGMREADVRKARGKPRSVAILRGRQLLDEFHYRLKVQLEAARKPVVLKELLYEDGRNKCIFLLTEVNGVWIVASDVEMPQNVDF